jgi:pseudouridine-5'-phosphate glycosidase
MKQNYIDYLRVSLDIFEAQEQGKPIVALESTVITHGLPYPQNLQLARDMEAQIRSQGVLPATVAVIDGYIYVGLEEDQLERLACEKSVSKISTRDIAPALSQVRSGGTTVAASIFLAETAGIRIFATGGIGGVHRDAPFDVSADLNQLAKSPMVVVCAGAKAILDIPATLEMLETLGVPVVGYQTDEFPAFYSRTSGFGTSVRVESPSEIARIAHDHWGLGFKSAVLVTLPPPPETALSGEIVESVVVQALIEAKSKNIRGQAVTPFLLEKVSELTHGSSLRANLDLLVNNARLAAQIAQYL